MQYTIREARNTELERREIHKKRATIHSAIHDERHYRMREVIHICNTQLERHDI